MLSSAAQQPNLTGSGSEGRREEGNLEDMQGREVGGGEMCSDDDQFSDEFLVVAGFRQQSFAWRVYRRGLAGVQAASDECSVM